MDHDEAEDLQGEQRRRAELEAEAAEVADEPEEAAAHERRAEKAAYLEEKLAERRRSEGE
jgi:hypothetical protein